MSSQAQKPDVQNQHAALKKFCKQQAIEVDEWVLEIGGGLNFERTQFLRLVDRIVSEKWKGWCSLIRIDWWDVATSC